MKREGNAVSRSLLAVAFGMLGCGADQPSEESIEYTHLYDARRDDAVVVTSDFADAYEPSILRVATLAEGTEPLAAVGVQNVVVSLSGDRGGIVLVTTDSIDVEVVSVDGGKMQLADFEQAGELDWDGQSVSTNDVEPGTFSASGWELAVDRSEISGTLAFDSPGNGHIEIAFTAPPYVDLGE